MGLEVFDSHRHCYHELPACGPGVATVLAGDLLARITRGYVVAPKHRVANTPEELLQPRVAATVFIQPALDAVLCPVSSSVVEAHGERQSSSRHRKAGPGKGHGKGGAVDDPVTYRAWKERVYGKYRRR